ncbi:hypothetical protein LGH70_17140 [Hymenobacter sp. BT635]|uniref:DUF4840 domain-containing protein n=1 Tax=Hymenobacter nitidus TaxID=2880929 RepID=A0ABS8AHK3_9BACT|nr:hypothetical protein [Hymenobacter nitidus]MCB2379326.1 hypothetical protein [Hymenobacter nitidus]
MKLLAAIGQGILLLTVLACSREKVPSEEIEGYSFTRSPKAASAQETVGMILGQVNGQQARQAATDGQDHYTGIGQVQEDGTVQVALPVDTDYLVVADSSAFQQVLEAQAFGASQPNAAARIDFKREFVVLLIHPPMAFSGATFLDGVQAEVEADNTVRLELSTTPLPASDLQQKAYGQYNYQVSMYKLARKDFQRAHIVFAGQEEDAPAYVPL